MKRTIAAFSLCVGASTFAIGGELPHCQLALHAVARDGTVVQEPFVSPQHVVSIVPVEVSWPGMRHWLVSLNESGASENEQYTGQNIGQRIAVLCDGKELARAVVQSQSGAQFVFGVPAPVKKNALPP